MYQIFSSLLDHLPFSVHFFLHFYGVTFFGTPNISKKISNSSPQADKQERRKISTAHDGNSRNKQEEEDDDEEDDDEDEDEEEEEEGEEKARQQFQDHCGSDNVVDAFELCAILANLLPSELNTAPFRYHPV